MAEPNSPDDRTRARSSRSNSTAGRDAPTGTGPRGQLSNSSALPIRLGRFEIHKLLGRGAFGCVYLASDPELGRQVAIKLPHPDTLTPEFRERFLREARATATIHHPNVCPVHDVGTEGDLPFIVMHYVVGGTLADLLDGLKQPLPQRQALVIARKLALGVEAAHARGVIHRDLKPGNVLYDRDAREVLITDFGLARIGAASGVTTDGAVMGTPAYMSPEQARGEVSAVGPLSDVYSLGVILYRVLTGDVPFQGSVFEVLMQHAKAPPRPPSAVRPDCDPALDAIVLKALAKNPADRYGSAKEFATALGEYLRAGAEGEPNGGGPGEPLPAEARPPVRRNALWVALGLLLIIVTAVGTVLLTRGSDDPSAPPAPGPSETVQPKPPDPAPPDPKLPPPPQPGDKLKAEIVGKWRFVTAPWFATPELKKLDAANKIDLFFQFWPRGLATYSGEPTKKGAGPPGKGVNFEYEVIGGDQVDFRGLALGVFGKTQATIKVVIDGDEMTISNDAGRSARLVRVK